MLPTKEVQTPSPPRGVTPSSESGPSVAYSEFTEGSEEEEHTDDDIVDYEPASHEAYLTDLSLTIEAALKGSKEEWNSLLDSLMRSRPFQRAAFYEGKPAMQFLQDFVRGITQKRNRLYNITAKRQTSQMPCDLIDSDDYYDEGVEPLNKLLIYSLPDIAKDEVAGIFAQYGNVVQCAKLNNGRALVFMKYVHEAKWIVTHLHKNVPQGLDRPIGCVYATPENIRRSRHRA